MRDTHHTTPMDNFTRIPNEFFDWVFPDLSDSELRVLLYVLRRTNGFNKPADAISMNQMCEGIRKYDGTMLDLGTDLSREGAFRAVARLHRRGLLAVDRGRGRSNPNIYAVRVRPDVAHRIEQCQVGELVHAIDPFRKKRRKGQRAIRKRADPIDHEKVYAVDSQKTGGKKGVLTKESRAQTFPLGQTHTPRTRTDDVGRTPDHSEAEAECLTPDGSEMDAILGRLTRVVRSRFSPRQERKLRRKLSGWSAAAVTTAIAEFSTETYWSEAGDMAAAFLDFIARLSRGCDSYDDNQ